MSPCCETSTLPSAWIKDSTSLTRNLTAPPPHQDRSLRRSLRRPEGAPPVAQPRDQIGAICTGRSTNVKPADSGPMAGRTVLVTGATAGIGKATDLVGLAAAAA